MFVAVLCLVACGHKDVKLRTDAVSDRAAIPALNTDSVTTLISDSGITRYRITATKWLVFDKAQPPYWEFPDGVFLEKFDEQLEVNSTLRSDYAHYNQESHEWHLKGNVHSVNEEGEIFDTPELFWDQDAEQVYSDSAIAITRRQTIIRGIGFRSNQTMTQYTITNPTGVIPLDEDTTNNPTPNTEQQTQSTESQTPSTEQQVQSTVSQAPDTKPQTPSTTVHHTLNTKHQTLLHDTIQQNRFHHRSFERNR